MPELLATLHARRYLSRRLKAVPILLTLAVLASGATPSLIAPTAVGATFTLGSEGWKVQSSALAAQGGAQISEPGFPTGSWLAVRPDDAGAPGTEIAALLQSGACPDVFYSEEMRHCFGFLSRVGPETVDRFAVPWWYRTDFQAEVHPGTGAQLVINGVVGQADLWVDGHELATQRTIQGAFAHYSFDVTRLLRPGLNSLALRVHPNDPTRMLTLDDVDWSQIPPDNNTGLQFPVQLHVSQALAIGDVHVVQADTQSLSSSTLTLKAQVSNQTNATQLGTVSATVTPPAGAGGPIVLTKLETLPAHGSVSVAFRSADYPQLALAHPDVWWPYQMGAQPLYGLSIGVSANGGPTDSESETFGIRTVGSELVGRSKLAPQGVRRFFVNGRPLLLRGGGWAEDLFLRYSAANIAAQVALIQNLGLNAIRTEGKQMPRDFYEQMDRAGILVNAGFQCCDAWQLEGDARAQSAERYDVMRRSAQSIGEELRDHPSGLDFSWSDNAPTARQEKVSLEGFTAAEFPDPLISSAEYKSSPRLGPSGEKEGPYDWVPPGYWYDSSHFNPADASRTNVGGAWGLDSEASAGDTVPSAGSLERFMSPFEQAALWQEPAFNQYHANYEPEVPGTKNEGYSFGTLFELDRAIASRFGRASSLAQYVEEAQLQNYETQRAEFEAYIDHSQNTPTPSTGIFYWQLNKGMPTLLWDLYNQEFDQAGSYFGAKEANRSLHVLYAYDTHAVALDNLTASGQAGLTVQSRVYSLSGQLLDAQTAGPVNVPADGVIGPVLTPRLPPLSEPPAAPQTVLLELLLLHRGAVIDRNVYWLSTQPDQVEWRRTEGEPHAVMSSYADMRGLRGLPTAQLQASARTEAQPGPNGADELTTVTITNVSTTPTAALFLRADLRRGSAAGIPSPGENELLPVAWSENDTTLWPGERETLTVRYRAADLRGESPVVSVSGWNVPTQNVSSL